jgi:hypothetical protein
MLQSGLQLIVLLGFILVALLCTLLSLLVCSSPSLSLVLLRRKNQNNIKKQKAQPKYTGSIQKKHLARRTKKNKIMKAKQIRLDKRSCPKVKRIEEERLKLHHCRLVVLKTSIISFLSKTPQKT